MRDCIYLELLLIAVTLAFMDLIKEMKYRACEDWMVGQK